MGYLLAEVVTMVMVERMGRVRVGAAHELEAGDCLIVDERVEVVAKVEMMPFSNLIIARFEGPPVSRRVKIFSPDWPVVIKKKKESAR
jgi:hypothetical protein